jgi:hypothetical protein
LDLEVILGVTVGEPVGLLLDEDLLAEDDETLVIELSGLVGLHVSSRDSTDKSEYSNIHLLKLL